MQAVNYYAILLSLVNFLRIFLFFSPEVTKKTKNKKPQDIFAGKSSVFKVYIPSLSDLTNLR